MPPARKKPLETSRIQGAYPQNFASDFKAPAKNSPGI
jgi:hypothetical protein